MISRPFFYSLLLISLAACATLVPPPLEPSPGHLRVVEAPPGEIPPVVEQVLFLPPPEPLPELDRYTVVVNEVPVKELLFALARDAKVNVDIHPGIEGAVTLNAIDQTLPQILDRIARQVNIRYEIKDNTVVVMSDEPYFRTYKVDYVNLARDTTGTVSVATQISTTGAVPVGGQAGGLGGGGANNSTTTITSTSNHRFWLTLAQNILAITGEKAGGGGPDQLPISENVIVNPESGLITARATSKEHEQIQAFIDSVLLNARRQVLIEATVVEVNLDDRYQAGIDWSILHADAAGNPDTGINVIGDLTSSVTFPLPQGTVPSLVLNYLDFQGGRAISATLQLLRQFGDLKVLSSPRIMTLNNQTAVLKVVRNVVYFEIDVEPAPTSPIGGTVGIPAVDTTAQTVPVGLVMTVTPQINENDLITLNVRPTISSILRFVPDPNPELRRVGVTPIDNLVPEIEVREMESVLRLNNGQVAVLGGLMKDMILKDTNSIPLLSDLPVLGDTLFKSRTRQYVKTELVIFLRPVVIRNPSLQGDLVNYRPFLEEQPYAGPRMSEGGNRP